MCSHRNHQCWHRLRLWVGSGGEPDADDTGEATIEFIFVAVAIIVPLLYLIVSLAALQSTVFASEAGAREAARTLAAAPTNTDFAHKQVDLAFSDQGLNTPTSVDFSCEPAACEEPTSVVTVTIEAHVPLPLVPTWVGQRATVPVTTVVSAPVEMIHVH